MENRAWLNSTHLGAYLIPDTHTSWSTGVMSENLSFEGRGRTLTHICTCQKSYCKCETCVYENQTLFTPGGHAGRQEIFEIQTKNFVVLVSHKEKRAEGLLQ